MSMFYSDQSTSSVFPRIQGHQSAPALVQGGDWGIRWRPTRRRGTQGRGRNRSGEHEKHKTFFWKRKTFFGNAILLPHVRKSDSPCLCHGPATRVGETRLKTQPVWMGFCVLWPKIREKVKPNTPYNLYKES
jgi:hypothetical protein